MTEVVAEAVLYLVARDYYYLRKFGGEDGELDRGIVAEAVL